MKPQQPHVFGTHDTSTRHDVTDEVEYMLPVTICRRGHVPPFPFGTIVKCMYPGLSLYDALDEKDQRNKLQMSPERVGLVVDTAWHIGGILEMHRIKVHSVNGSERPRVAEPCLDLWYHLEFKEGRYWARYNWLEVVLEPKLCREAASTPAR